MACEPERPKDVSLRRHLHSCYEHLGPTQDWRPPVISMTHRKKEPSEKNDFYATVETVLGPQYSFRAKEETAILFPNNREKEETKHCYNMPLSASTQNALASEIYHGKKRTICSMTLKGYSRVGAPTRRLASALVRLSKLNKRQASDATAATEKSDIQISTTLDTPKQSDSRHMYASSESNPETVTLTKNTKLPGSKTTNTSVFEKTAPNKSVKWILESH